MYQPEVIRSSSYFLNSHSITQLSADVDLKNYLFIVSGSLLVGLRVDPDTKSDCWPMRLNNYYAHYAKDHTYSEAKYLYETSL